MKSTKLNGKYDVVRYNITPYLTIVDSSKNIPIRDLAFITIANSYHDSLMSDIKCKVIINREDFIDIQKTQLKLTLKLDEFIMNKTPEIKETIFEHTFRVTPLYATEGKDFSGMTQDFNDADDSDSTMAITFMVMDDEFISKYRKVSSGIYGNSNINTLIANEFGSRGIKCLFSPSDNTDLISKSIPLMNLLAIVTKLDKDEGIYKKIPAMFYRDIDRTYLLNQYNPVFEKDEIENINITISDPVSGDIEEGVIVNDTGYVFNTVTLPNIFDNSHVTEFANCNNLMVSNPINQNIETSKFANELSSIDRVISSKNKFINTWVDTKVNEPLVLTLPFDGMYLDCIKPNKRFNVINNTKIEDKEGTQFIDKTGEYRLHSSQIMINKDSEDGYKVTGQMTIVKLNK